MRVYEVITEIDRRGFLRGAGAAAIAAAAPNLAKAGEYQSLDTIKKDPTTWNTRLNELQQRSTAMLSKLAKAAGPAWAKKLEGTQINVQSNAQYIQADAENRDISIDVSVFWDAPDDVLAFAIGHELGHIALGHLGDAPTPAQSRKDEMDADDFAVKLCKLLGYNKAGLFKFLHAKKSDYDYFNLISSQANSTHPSYTQRLQQAKQKGFQLSKGGVQQLNTLATHLA
jgi:Zn-dependent protease with chaperone function